MASERKLQANRANARASTGPKTVEGKARSAKNALQHGLSIPIPSDRSLSDRAALLVSKLDGDGVTPQIQELLNHFVEAQLEVTRARRAYHELVTTALNNPDFEPQRSLMRRSQQLRVLSRNLSSITEEALRNVARPQLEGGAKYAAIVSEYGKRLAALARYERRAVSRRKFAVRALDAAGFKWPKTMDGDLLKLIES